MTQSAQHEWIQWSGSQLGVCSCGVQAYMNCAEYAAHVASVLAAQTPDYKTAWLEINKVYKRACMLIGPEYLGWNWVHALVDKLEKEEISLSLADAAGFASLPAMTVTGNLVPGTWEARDPSIVVAQPPAEDKKQ